MDAVRFKGTIAEWNDDRGFGFIKPAEGDERGRLQARQVRYGSAVRRERGSRQPAAASPPRLATAIVGMSAFFIAVLVAVVMGGAPWWVIPWYVVLSVVTFAAYGCVWVIFGGELLGLLHQR